MSAKTLRGPVFKFIGLLSLVMLASSATAPALTPNIPAGTLTPNFAVITRLGTFQRAINYGPVPRIPPVPHHWQGQAIVILDLSVRTGYVDVARIWQSTGSKEVDDALIATLQQWRVQPRICYKLYVPITISGGNVRLGSNQPL